MRISLAGPFYTARSVLAAAQTCMNLIPEAVEVPNEVSRLTLYGRPGLKHFVSMPEQKIRAMWAGGGRLFVIAGNGEYEVKQNGSMLNWGTVQESPEPPNGSWVPDPAQIFSNTTQLLIISGGYAYCDNGQGARPLYFNVTGTGNTTNANSTLTWATGPQFDPSWVGLPINIGGAEYIVGSATTTTITVTTPMPDATGVSWTIAAGDTVTASTGGFLDGYFFISRPATPGVTGDPGRQFAMSALMDGTSWSPLDFGVKESAPDYLRSVLCDHEELWLFGTQSIEVWTNVGSQVVNGVATFPFQRIPGAIIRDGSAATYAPTSVAQTICYLGLNADGHTVAYMITGLQPQRISTHAVEQAWNQPGYRVDDAVGYSYGEDGHVFWVLNMWQQQETYVYDVTEGLWHTRAAWHPDTKQWDRYWPWYHVYLPEWDPDNTGVPTGAHVVGNPQTGDLYFQSLNYYSDAGNSIQHQRAFPHLINENQFAYHHRFELLMEMGAAQPGLPAPLIGLDWSDDHGQTFNDQIARLNQLDANGDYKRRLAFRRLGKARDRVYRVGIESVTKTVLVDAYLEATPGFA